jgi:hypothetical protein
MTLLELRELAHRLRADRECAVCMEERVRISVQIARVDHQLVAAIVKGER